MRPIRTLALAFTLVFVGAPALSGASVCIPSSHLSSDNDMLTLVQQFAFIGEGRIGDRGGAATFELDLGPDTGAPAQTANYAWPNGAPVAFTLTYDSGADLVTFDMGGHTLTYTPGSGFSELFVRTRATDGGTSVVVDSLQLDGVDICGQSAADGSASGLDILRIENQNLQDGFVLTGRATMTWTGTPPSQSHLAFQLKVASAIPLPAQPASWGRVKALYR